MIKGFTDPQSRRLSPAGKIRAGTKDQNTGYPKNAPHFVMHDAPQLIPILGEKPTEIYFTVAFDNPRAFHLDDLRWYSKSELICQSAHDAVDPATNQPLGTVAKFNKVGMDAVGLRKEQFPGSQRSFIRNCAFQSCPDYIKQGGCKPHLTLDIIVPQYSMFDQFRLDNTSIYAVRNVQQALDRAFLEFNGKYRGIIFRIYKEKDEIAFPDKSGNRTKRETDVINMEYVPFHVYEAKFRDKVSPENWSILSSWNSSTVPVRNVEEILIGPAFGGSLLLDSGEELPAFAPAQLAPAAAAPKGTLAAATEAASEDAIKERANHPDAAKYFEEISALAGKANTEEARIATAKHFPSVERMIAYLDGKIKDGKKVAKGAAKLVQAPAEAVPATAAPVAPAQGEAPLF